MCCGYACLHERAVLWTKRILLRAYCPFMWWYYFRIRRKSVAQAPGRTAEQRQQPLDTQNASRHKEPNTGAWCVRERSVDHWKLALNFRSLKNQWNFHVFMCRALCNRWPRLRLWLVARTHSTYARDRPSPVISRRISRVLFENPLEKLMEIHHFIWLTLNYVPMCFSPRCCSNELYTNIAPSVNRVIRCHRNAHLLLMANSVRRRCLPVPFEFIDLLYLNYGSYFSGSVCLQRARILLVFCHLHDDRSTYFRYLISVCAVAYERMCPCRANS